MHMLQGFVWCYSWVFDIMLLMQWLVGGGVIARPHPWMHSLMRILDVLTRPFLNVLRRFFGRVRGVDTAPLAAVFLLWGLQVFIGRMMGH